MSFSRTIVGFAAVVTLSTGPLSAQSPYQQEIYKAATGFYPR